MADAANCAAPSFSIDVAAAAVPGLFEAGEHAVRLREPAGKALGLHRAARDDAVAVEQQARRGGRAQRGVGLGRGQQRPASADGRRARGHGCRDRAHRGAAVEPGARRLAGDAVRLRSAADAACARARRCRW